MNHRLHATLAPVVIPTAATPSAPPFDAIVTPAMAAGMEPLIDLRRLYYFTRIVHFGSYHEAALHEAIAQSALSRHVRALEQQVGMQLLVRGKAGARPTAAGMVLYRSAVDIFRRNEAMKLSLRHHATTPHDIATIALPVSFAAFLMPRLSNLAAGVSNRRLRIIEGSARHVEAWVLAGEADVGVVVMPCDLPNLNVEPLYAENMYLISSAANIPEQTPPLTFEQAARLPLVLPALPHGTRLQLERLAAARGLRFDPLLEVDNPHTQKYLIMHNGLHTIGSSMAYQEEIAAGVIVLTPIVPEAQRHLAIATLDRAKYSSATRALIRLLRQSVPLSLYALGDATNPSDVPSPKEETRDA